VLENLALLITIWLRNAKNKHMKKFSIIITILFLLDAIVDYEIKRRTEKEYWNKMAREVFGSKYLNAVEFDSTRKTQTNADSLPAILVK
jgi:hypothetical protein